MEAAVFICQQIVNYYLLNQAYLLKYNTENIYYEIYYT